VLVQPDADRRACRIRAVGEAGSQASARISPNSRGSFAQVSPAFSLAYSSP
jgi:hypothetical protein